MYRRFLTLAAILIASLLLASACGLLPGSQDAEAPAEETGSEESTESDEAASDDAEPDDAEEPASDAASADETDAEPGDAEEPASDAADAEPGDEDETEDASEPGTDDPEAAETEDDTGDTDTGDTDPAPSTNGTMVGEVISGGNIRTQPDLADEVVQGEVCPGDSLTILEEQTADEITWYRVRITAATTDCVANRVAINTEGWISSVLVTEPVPATGSAPAAAEPEATPAPEAPDAPDSSSDAPEPSTVTVTNGGYIRTQPLIADETVQGELCMGDMVQILEDQVADDILWYRIRVASVVEDCVPNHVAVGTEGWVSDLLLGTP